MELKVKTRATLTAVLSFSILTISHSILPAGTYLQGLTGLSSSLRRDAQAPTAAGMSVLFSLGKHPVQRSLWTYRRSALLTTRMFSARQQAEGLRCAGRDTISEETEILFISSLRPLTPYQSAATRSAPINPDAPVHNERRGSAAVPSQDEKAIREGLSDR